MLNEKDDKYLIFNALSMWANYIETNDPVIGAQEAERSGQKDKINVLSHDQMVFIVRLRDLALRHLVK